MSDDLQQALRDQLKSVNDEESSKKQLLASELQPLSVALVDMASEKIRGIANEGIKRGAKKVGEVIQKSSGLKTLKNLMDKKEELTENAKNMLSNANFQANTLMGQAQDHIQNDLSLHRDTVHNVLNGFNMEEEEHLPSHLPSIAPHINTEIEGAEDMGRLLSKL